MTDFRLPKVGLLAISLVVSLSVALITTDVAANQAPGTPLLPEIKGPSTVIAASTGVKNSIGSTYQINDPTSIGWSSVKVRIYSGGPKLDVNLKIPTVDVQGEKSNIVFLTGPIPDVEKVLNSISFFPYISERYNLKISVEPSLRFISRGNTYYFNRFNGHYYRYVTRQEAQATNRSEMMEYAKKTRFAGVTPYLATFAGYGISPYEQGGSDHEFTFILDSKILTDNKSGRPYGPIALTSGIRCDSPPTQAQISQGTCPSTNYRSEFYWMPGSGAPSQDQSNLRKVNPQGGNPWYQNEPNGSGNILVTSGWSTEAKNFLAKYRMMDTISTNSFAGGALSNEGITLNGNSHNVALLWDDIPDLPNYFDGAILEYGSNNFFTFDSSNKIERTILITGKTVTAPTDNSDKSKKTSNPKPKVNKVISIPKSAPNIGKPVVGEKTEVIVTCVKGSLTRKFSSKRCPPGWRKK